MRHREHSSSQINQRKPETTRHTTNCEHKHKRRRSLDIRTRSHPRPVSLLHAYLDSIGSYSIPIFCVSESSIFLNIHLKSIRQFEPNGPGRVGIEMDLFM